MEKDIQSSPADSTTEMLLRAMRRFLRPLVRLLIEKGISFPQLRELLKSLYVEVADEEFSLQGKRPSDSRVFVLTGVHRKDVKRLRNREQGRLPAASAVSTLGAELVAHWLGDAAFQDETGKPVCLPRLPQEGGPSFDVLVASVSKDVRPRVVLDEWLRLGIVSLDAQDQVCLQQNAFVPAAGFEEKAWFLGRHLGDHTAACVHNLLQETSPMFERSVYYSGLTAESVARLRDQAEERGMAMLRELNQIALTYQQTDESKADADQRMRFGAYWFDAKQREESEDAHNNEATS